jgi:allophanate hydrolase
MPNISELHNLYATDPNALSTTVKNIYDRIEREGLKPVWISIVPRENAMARVKKLSLIPIEDRTKLPLYGIPFAVKDNIDVVNLSTTAACPTFAREPATENAPVVERLEQAGAIVVGKTNMDQCATVFNPKYISGGSSSGSAVAVGSGLVSTDSFYDSDLSYVLMKTLFK